MATRKKPQHATAERLSDEALVDLFRLKAWLRKYGAKTFRKQAATMERSWQRISTASNAIVCIADQCVGWTLQDGKQDDLNHARLYFCFVATLIDNNDELNFKDPSFLWRGLVEDLRSPPPT